MYISGVNLCSSWSKRTNTTQINSKLRSKILRKTRKQCCTRWRGHKQSSSGETSPFGQLLVPATPHTCHTCPSTSLTAWRSACRAQDWGSHHLNQQEQAEWTQGGQTAGIDLRHMMRKMWELWCAGFRHSAGLHARVILDGATCRLRKLGDVRGCTGCSRCVVG